MSATPNIRIKEPSNARTIGEARSVHANWEKSRSEVDGSRQREGGVFVEQGECFPMGEGYPEQCWKVVDFTPTGVIVVSDFWDDDHVMDYDNCEAENRNYTTFSWDDVEELKE